MLLADLRNCSQAVRGGSDQDGSRIQGCMAALI